MPKFSSGPRTRPSCEESTRSDITRFAPTEEEYRITRAVIDVMKRIPQSRVIDFVRVHPLARVKDFSAVYLSGMVLESKGGTTRAYQAVNNRLQRARRAAGLPKLASRGPDVAPRRRHVNQP